MSLLEMSLRGGILILVIALVRALTLHHLPKCTFLLLWALAALQLTVPVSLPARFSVYTLVTQLASVSTGKMISGTPLTGTTLLPGTVSLPENAVVFYTKATEEPGWRTEDFWGGTLCYIFKTPMEEWIAGGRSADVPTAFRVLGETDAYVYRMVFPGDVNYDPENQAQTQRYEEMWDTLYSGDLAFEIFDSPQ